MQYSNPSVRLTWVLEAVEITNIHGIIMKNKLFKKNYFDLRKKQKIKHEKNRYNRKKKKIQTGITNEKKKRKKKECTQKK